MLWQSPCPDLRRLLRRRDSGNRTAEYPVQVRAGVATLTVTRPTSVNYSGGDDQSITVCFQCSVNYSYLSIQSITVHLLAGRLLNGLQSTPVTGRGHGVATGH